MVASVDDLEIAGQVIASTGIQPFLGQKSDPEHRGWAVSRFAFIEFPEEMKLEEGMELHVTDEDGQHQAAFVAKFDKETVQLDFNHPLAGAELHFSVKVVALREPTEEELDHGHVHEEGHHH